MSPPRFATLAGLASGLLLAALFASVSVASGLSAQWRRDPLIRAFAETEPDSWNLGFTATKLMCDGAPPPNVEVVLAQVDLHGLLQAAEVIRPHHDCGFWTTTRSSRARLLQGWELTPPASEEAEALAKWRGVHRSTLERAEAGLSQLKQDLSSNQLIAAAVPGSEVGIRAAEAARQDEAGIRTAEAEVTAATAELSKPIHETLALSLSPNELTLGPPSGPSWAGPRFLFYGVVTPGHVLMEGSFTYWFEGHLPSITAGWPASVRNAFMKHRRPRAHHT